MQRIQINAKNSSINEHWSLGNVSYEIFIADGVLENQIGISEGKVQFIKRNMGLKTKIQLHKNTQGKVNWLVIPDIIYVIIKHSNFTSNPFWGRFDNACYMALFKVSII